ncbi:MAG: hypothetical protein QGH06_01365 [Lutibacter sp.]|nr:hypothetical protein [Lutibacter sp.]
MKNSLKKIVATSLSLVILLSGFSMGIGESCCVEVGLNFTHVDTLDDCCSEAANTDQSRLQFSKQACCKSTAVYKELERSELPATLKITKKKQAAFHGQIAQYQAVYHARTSRETFMPPTLPVIVKDRCTLYQTFLI